MKIFTSGQVIEIDKYTIENEPIASIDLMERASFQITQWITDHYDQHHSFIVFAGPGNNGGDGLAVARMLAEKFYRIRVVVLWISDKLSPDALRNYNLLKTINSIEVTDLHERDEVPVAERNEIIVDAIFGSGLNRPPEGFAARVIRFINKLQNIKISIDIPSGLFGEDNSKNKTENIIKATHTLTLQFPPLSFFFAENEEFTGSWAVLPIGLHPDAIEQQQTFFKYIQQSDILPILQSRKKFSHKGTYGNVLLIAGCYGMMGAAVLAGKACLRAGSGLVTIHLPGLGYQIVQTALPEAVISIDESELVFTGVKVLPDYKAIGIGPGLGCHTDTQKAVYNLLKKNDDLPMVIDADGLNILSVNKTWLDNIPPETILTPHPKEFERLAGKTKSGFERNMLLRDFAMKYKLIVILKGAFTSIAFPDGTCSFNSTGNPGMATAGSGDVLTGIILSLLGQGYQPGNAALLGVYLHGLAGDLAAENESQESVIAGDIIGNIGKAYRILHNYRG
ncbi:MAG: hypothetical protein AMS27_09390 [Bacteroides sp. SM23_62_1]|nr:MAG: hypothetical protein AMS27_09390 [Bacteroides sp. SM23_62_1]